MLNILNCLFFCSFLFSLFSIFLVFFFSLKTFFFENFESNFVCKKYVYIVYAKNVEHNQTNKLDYEHKEMVFILFSSKNFFSNFYQRFYFNCSSVLVYLCLFSQIIQCILTFVISIRFDLEKTQFSLTLPNF